MANENFFDKFITKSEWDFDGYREPDKYPFNDYLSEVSPSIIYGSLLGIDLIVGLHYCGKSFVTCYFIFAKSYWTLALIKESWNKCFSMLLYHWIGLKFEIICETKYRKSTIMLSIINF